jgi:hypothetical protein
MGAVSSGCGKHALTGVGMRPMRSETLARALRCAIYTRVCTGSGLEQDFNSLDNQREASEAYIQEPGS